MYSTIEGKTNSEDNSNLGGLITIPVFEQTLLNEKPSENSGMVPSVPNSSFRNVNNIVETTNNLILTLDNYSKEKSTPETNSLSKKGKGIRVEDLINKFKQEARFDTMTKKSNFKTENSPWIGKGTMFESTTLLQDDQNSFISARDISIKNLHP